MLRYFIDLDNTLCYTENGDYKKSTPIQERIAFVNDLKLAGNHITIWTARGSMSKVDYRELTVLQLKDWGVQYDELLLGKPDYDVYLDDKSFNIEAFYPVPPPTTSPLDATKKQTSEIVEKGWGKEIIFANNPEYCGKILCFEKGKKFSMHYHLRKKETWFVTKGQFILNWIQPDIGKIHSEYLNVGDVVTNERGHAHQLVALEDGEVFEVSTEHYDEDSFRIYKGH
jgi:mannose-6-phosphate isomerase-like protein (cupin superfamily)